MSTESKAHGFFLEGVKKHGAFDRSLKQARADGMDAAFLFLQARELVEHGQWGQFLELHADRISPRTVRFYCQLADEAVLWVQADQPKLKLLSDIQVAARHMVMQSPKPLIALCRELGHMRKFGEYNAIKYAIKKSGQAQIEFNFDKLTSSLDVLTHFGDENYSFVYPEGKDESEYLGEVEAKLEAALVRIRTIKEHGRVLDV